MRLKQIKLAGFKSFIDPTTVNFPGNRCSIVGPNGGGKSNIVDAVRWVMGESSAKQLRGENLASVIFNGSSTRKLAGAASIELLFDNSEGRFGGEYAAYAEISIRRQVSRDSQSIYFLNGARCRRRDIADIFLGTGFGPRSYSIIEQSMIGQLAVARPEELRVYLEEAAGISKYKERRRETENRIRHTRENLERLRDTREELGRTLERLRKQAEAAERYRELKEEERLRSAELHAIRYRDISGRLAVLQRELRRKEVDFERVQAEQQSVDTDIAAARLRYEETNDESREEQARYYRLGENIARIEESLQFNRARVKEFERDLDELRGQTEETARQLAMDQDDIETLQETIAGMTPEVAAAERQDTEAAQQLEAIERAYVVWQEDWDEFSRQAAENEQSARLQASRIEHADESIAGLSARLVHLAEEENAPSAVEIDQVDDLAADIAAHQQHRTALAEDIGRCLDNLAGVREEILMREADLEQARQHLQTLRHDLARMQAAQQAALGRADDGVRHWLTEQGLDGTNRVGEALSVVPGWERAVEMVMGELLQGLRVDDAAAYADALPALSGGHLALVEARIDAPEPQGELPGLVSLIRSTNLRLGAALHGVFAAESDAVAWAGRARLKPGESIVTRSCLWLGPDWLRKLPEADADTGIIERAQEIETLEVRVEEAEGSLGDLQRGLDAARDRGRALEKERETLQARASETQDLLAELKADHGVQRVRLEAAGAHRDRLQRDRAEIERQVAREQASLAEARAKLATLQEAAKPFASRRQTLAESKGRLLEELDKARQTARARHERLHALSGTRQGHASRLEAIRTARQRLVGQAADFERRRVALEDNIAQTKAPLSGLQADLEAKLADQHEAEERQREVRIRLEKLGEHMRELEAARDAAALRFEAARNELESARVERQGLNVQAANARGQVEDAGHELGSVLGELPEAASEDATARQLERIDRHIRRLQPVNLAAIDEYGVESERKAWLDSQHEDLERALATLQAAIRKIDTQTRARFKDTFQAVNAHLAELFPKLFGGGRAHLTLTGEDLLDTGVSLMARPPGKRNASVHQLSGGEQALTAVALIFAIFRLNPSPVCLLDEVDAALDDNNVIRVAQLIREMSDAVQFIVVTHNKLTMEMADHLIGVTMSEPGVSRLVSVDIEAAAAMAAS